jgi:hypothetical protein
MENSFGRYPGLPPRLDPGIGPVMPGNGGEVRPAGPPMRDAFGYPLPSGNVVVPVPGGLVGPHSPPPPVNPER